LQPDGVLAKRLPNSHCPFLCPRCVLEIGDFFLWIERVTVRFEGLVR
jgi:hypothetical protein